MTDIFISYSSKDREKAEQLTELLISAGFSVWIDKQGIDGAMNWSSQIVTAINDCHSLLFLISKNSAGSHNCAKEVQLASEKQKNILPVVIEDAQLPVVFEYPLAGLQRVGIGDIDGVISALKKLQGGKNALDAMMALSEKVDDRLFRLAVLPFEDQSSANDNAWFSDGLTDELIFTLSRLSELVVTDRQTTRHYRNTQISSGEIARDLGVRYLLTGAVRKHGDNIKISTTLIDSTLERHLWTNAFTGTMDNAFSIQESVALEVAKALRLQLTPQEERRLVSHATIDGRAYELHLRARKLYQRQSKESCLESLRLEEQATAFDPEYGESFANIATICASMYRLYDRNPEWIERAFAAAERAVALDPTAMRSHAALALVYQLRGDEELAIEEAKKGITLEPSNAASYFYLGFVYNSLRKYKESIAPYRRALDLDPTLAHAYQNLLSVYAGAGQNDKLQGLAAEALPHFQRTLRVDPFSYMYKCELAQCYGLLGKMDEAEKILRELLRDSNDPLILFNAGVGLTNLQIYADGYLSQKRAYELGFKKFDLWRGKKYAERHQDDEALLVIIRDIDNLVMTKQQEVANG